jgi:F-type H+-transporting ATPase subunit alpha
MRQVAGRLRLDLAQYRDLAAFAQFGADLGESVRRQLLRGEKLTEVLKQDEGAPLPVGKEVAAVFAGVSGYLDDIPTPKVREFERQLLGFIDRKHASLLTRLADPQKGADALPDLKQAVEAFKKESNLAEPARA